MIIHYYHKNKLFAYKTKTKPSKIKEKYNTPEN